MASEKDLERVVRRVVREELIGGDNDAAGGVMNFGHLRNSARLPGTNGKSKNFGYIARQGNVLLHEILGEVAALHALVEDQIEREWAPTSPDETRQIVLQAMRDAAERVRLVVGDDDDEE